MGSSRQPPEARPSPPQLLSEPSSSQPSSSMRDAEDVPAAWPGLQPLTMQDAVRLSPGSPHLATHPATPDAVEDLETDYFPPMRNTPSPHPRSSRPASSGRPMAVAGSEVRPAQDRMRRSSIRIRRNSNNSLPQQQQTGTPSSELPSHNAHAASAAQQRSRPRSISQPISVPAPAYDANAARHSRRAPQIAMPRLTEEGARPSLAELGIARSPISPTRSLPDGTFRGDGPRPASVDPEPATKKLNRKQKLSRLFWPGHNNPRPAPPPSPPQGAPGAAQQPHVRSDEFEEELVDWLDIIDPEVQTLSTLTNVQNSLFVPDLGSWLNRRPTYVLSQYPEQLRPPSRTERAEGNLQEAAQLTVPTGPDPSEPEAGPVRRLLRSDTITSKLTESHYAALPHGLTLEGWSEAEKLELDDHVRHMLHSRRSKFKRMMKGFGQYIRRPLGFFVTLYATLITLFGLAWVLFLIGWIYVGDQQVYAVHIIDSVLVALFAVMGDGLAPFRAVDTYHTIFVVHYTRMIQKGQTKKQESTPRGWSRASLPGNTVLAQNNAAVSAEANSCQGALDPLNASESAEQSTSHVDNMTRAMDQNMDLESAKLEAEYDEDSPLTYKQWKTLRHHQEKLAKSHSFYKPDETFTHYSFPLGFLMAIIILLDCHSCLQISLGATTWGIDYHDRNPAITTVILCVSITCNLTAGLVISIGDRRTRKKDVVALLNRQELTGDAIKHLEVKRAKESKSYDIGADENQQGGVLIKEEA